MKERIARASWLLLLLLLILGPLGFAPGCGSGTLFTKTEKQLLRKIIDEYWTKSDAYYNDEMSPAERAKFERLEKLLMVFNKILNRRDIVARYKRHPTKVISPWEADHLHASDWATINRVAVETFGPGTKVKPGGGQFPFLKTAK